MALTLDATLATAQDSQSRHPLVEIVSSQGQTISLLTARF